MLTMLSLYPSSEEDLNKATLNGYSYLNYILHMFNLTKIQHTCRKYFTFRLKIYITLRVFPRNFLKREKSRNPLKVATRKITFRSREINTNSQNRGMKAATSIYTTSEQQITRSLIKKKFHLFESTGKQTPNLENLYKALMIVKSTSTENESFFQ